MKLLSKLADGADGLRTAALAGPGRGTKAVCGFSVRWSADRPPVLERFGNVKSSAAGPVVEESREPLIDLFDEPDHLRLVAELPGVELEDIEFRVEGEALTLRATRGDRRYATEVALPGPVSGEAAAPSYRNGVFELCLPKR